MVAGWVLRNDQAAGSRSEAESAQGAPVEAVVESPGQGRRLAYLCLETPRPGQAAYTHVHEIVAGLRSGGWHVELITTEAGGASAGRSFTRRALDFVCAQARLLRRVADFDAVYMRAHPAAVVASLAARLRGVPVFQEVNGKPTDLAVTYPRLRPVVPLLAWAYRVQLARAAHVFAVTEGLADWVCAHARHERVSVVPNGANTNVFRPGAGASPIAGRYVIFVGGLVGWHGIDTMLAAARDPAWPGGVRLVVVGDGVERGKLEALKDGDRVLWLGRRPYEDLPPLVGGAIAALCVIEDPQGRSATGVAPIKMFEAMACATPVIVSELPFQADLVRRTGAGIVVPMADAGALAAAVAELASAPEAAVRAMGQRGRAFVEQHAAWQVRADETSEVMLRVMTGADARSAHRDRTDARVMAVTAATTGGRARGTRVAVLAFSRITRDARVLRQCALLADMGEAPLVIAYAEEGDSIPYRLSSRPVPKPSTRLRLWTAARQLPSHLGTAAARAGFWAEPRHRWALGELERHRPGLVIANDWPALVVAAAYKARHGAIIHYDSHEFATLEFDDRAYWRLVYKPMVTRLEREAIAAADSVSTIGPKLAGALHGLYRLPRVPTVVRSIPGRIELAENADAAWPLRILYHGLLLPGRGLEELIASTALWREAHTLTLRGDGPAPYVADLKARAAATGRGGTIVFEPAVKPADVMPVAARSADVGVFFTSLETDQRHFTLPNKLFEYIGAGLAVAVSPAVDLRAVVESHGVGVVSRDAGVTAIADTINALTREQVVSFKAAARTAARTLNWECERELLRAVLRPHLQRIG